MRIASPYRLRAARFDHVLVGSLQDGEFPRRDRGADPFLSEAQRETLGLDPRRDTEAEERYLFHACLALPRRSLVLSYRDSDEDGAATARSPLVDDVRALLAPAPDGAGPDPVEAAITVARDLAQVVAPLAEAPSEDELARALAAHGPGADAPALLAEVGVGAEPGPRIAARVGGARRAEAASRAPGPLTNPAALESLAAVAAYGGTTLEEFDVCSYRWFAGHELDPQLLDPVPDPLVQGGLMHEALDRLFSERPGGDSLPRPATLAAWTERGRLLLAEIVAERELGDHPAERAMARRVERLLERFLAEEAERDPGGFEPWLLEARFGEHPDAERPALDLGGWGLHGAVDRVDRSGDGRAVVIDYKLAVPGHPAGEVRGAGEAAAAALPAGRRRALGRRAGRRPLPPAARHLLAAPARGRLHRGSRGPRRLRPLPQGRGRARGAGGAAGGVAAARRRDRRPDADGRHPPRSRPAPGPARTRRLPGVVHLRPDLPPRPGPALGAGRGGRGAVSARR